MPRRSTFLSLAFVAVLAVTFFVSRSRADAAFAAYVEEMAYLYEGSRLAERDWTAGPLDARPTTPRGAEGDLPVRLAAFSSPAQDEWGGPPMGDQGEEIESEYADDDTAEGGVLDGEPQPADSTPPGIVPGDPDSRPVPALAWNDAAVSTLLAMAEASEAYRYNHGAVKRALGARADRFRRAYDAFVGAYRQYEATLHGDDVVSVVERARRASEDAAAERATANRAREREREAEADVQERYLFVSRQFDADLQGRAAYEALEIRSGQTVVLMGDPESVQTGTNAYYRVRSEGAKPVTVTRWNEFRAFDTDEYFEHYVIDTGDHEADDAARRAGDAEREAAGLANAVRGAEIDALTRIADEGLRPVLDVVAALQAAGMMRDG